jgi:transcriptional regulator
MGDSLELVRGTLALLILNALSTGEKHGYAVSEWIETHSDGSLLVEEGTLYPALHRLERQGWIAASWGASENNRRAKFYELTAAGRRQLERETATWERLSEAVSRVLRHA